MQKTARKSKNWVKKRMCQFVDKKLRFSYQCETGSNEFFKELLRMALSFLLGTLDEVPPELIASAKLEAERDAWNVNCFLERYSACLGKRLKKPLRLPKRFLTFLALGLRLLIYEKKQVFEDSDFAFPSSEEVVRMAFRSLSDKSLNPDALKEKIYGIDCDQFAWDAQRELKADITISDFNEELLLEAVADFLSNLTTN